MVGKDGPEERTPRRPSNRRIQSGRTLLLIAALIVSSAAPAVAASAEAPSATSHPRQRSSRQETGVSAAGPDAPSVSGSNDLLGVSRAVALASGLIVGLDGELYEAYLPATIERVQEALRTRGLYDGPVSGALDPPTMRAIYEFQEASYGLHRCGVPTPRTRRLLQQGSHTP